MINIVMWLSSNRYQDNLHTVCAGNNICIVADEFENAEAFLDEFDKLDVNIDVLVISDGLLHDVDKKQFFDNVRSSEPNIRIVIVFPGYRNQYIEEQISEYKNVYGISDIIYEGQQLDSDCFVEVIKKGYIYDYEVNVYDGPEEAVKPIRKKPSCITVGVMGLTRGCGVTNMVVNVANYISLTEDISVKAVDFSGTGNLRFAKGKKVTFIVHSGIDVDRLKKTSRAVVYDFGTPFHISAKGKLLSDCDEPDTEKIKLFRECDLKICMCYADSWHIGKMKYLLNDRQWKRTLDSSYLFLLDSVPDKFKAGHSRVNIYGRNDKAVSEHIAGLFAGKGGG